MTKEYRIVIDAKEQNRHMRAYSVNWMISHYVIEKFSFPVPPHQRTSVTRCGPIASELISHLSEFDGVSELFLIPYECSVIRGAAFKWGEIEPKIIAALVATLPEDLQNSVVVAYAAGKVPKNQNDLGLAHELLEHQSFFSQ